MAVDLPCMACEQRLKLPIAGCHGSEPMPWHALNVYDGAFRQLLLQLKRLPTKPGLAALINRLAGTLQIASSSVLVPVPSWKTKRGNPLPATIATGLGPPVRHLLRRSRTSVGQHRLSRQQRLENLKGAFQSTSSTPQRQVWIVDDILTTGATAVSAKVGLERAGHEVLGIICLGRTPAQRNRR